MTFVHPPRQRLLNVSLAAAFGTALGLGSLSSSAQTPEPSPLPSAPRAAAVRPPTLPAVTVRGQTDVMPSSESSAGSKTRTPIIEIPQSVSVVTAERVEAIGATTLRDALGYTPGVTISPYGSDSRYDWISLRGFDAYTPGFYQDGLPLRNAFGFAVWKTENYGTERIEVLRGPASVLYGQGGPGGVVNTVSKRPTSTAVREVQVQLGTDNRRQVAGDIGGALDAEGRLRYRLTGLFRDAELPAEGMTDDRFFFAPSLTWKPDDATTLTVYAQGMRNRAGVYTRNRPWSGSLFPTPAGTTIPSSLFTGNPNFDHFNQNQALAGYEAEHRFDDKVTLRQNFRYGRMSLDYAQLQAPTYVQVNGDPTDPVNYQTLARTPFGSAETARGFTIDNQVQVDVAAGDWRHRVLVGLDHQRNRFGTKGFYGDTAPDLNIGAPAYDNGPFAIAPLSTMDSTRLTQTGLYLQDQIKWRDAWQLTLGGRYDRAQSRLTNLLDGSVTEVADNEFTARAGLVHVMSNGLAPYLSYTESFSPVTNINPLTQQPFEPETGRQVEAGIRYQPPGSSARFSAAVFDLRRQNMITRSLTALEQTGEVTVRGIEIEATGQPLPKLNLTASYSHTPKAEVTASVDPAEIGRQATAVPRHQLALWADYRFAFGLKAGLGARYTGRTNGNGGGSPIPVPAYALFDAILGYEIDRWSLALNVRNLTDKTHFANCETAAESCYYGDQRQAMVTATYRW